MRALLGFPLIALGIVGAVDVVPAQGQVVVDQAATAGESYSRGIANMISAAGDFNLQTAQAAVYGAQARSQEIQNRAQWTNTYFQMREANRAFSAQERGPRPTEQQLVAFAKAGRPSPLSPSEVNVSTGTINWPIALQQNSFSNERATIEAAFAKRAETGGMSLDDINLVRGVAGAMQDQLRADIRSMPSNIYLAAKRFLDSISFGVTQPMS